MIWITSDTHFAHQKSFLYEPRGFNSVEDMNEAIIENWNNVVSAEDTVYHLGDVILSNTEAGLQCLKRLNGNIILLRGNHDSDARVKLYQELPNIKYEGYATIIKDGKWHFYLSHYPTLVGNSDDVSKPIKNRLLNICGHSHVKDKWADLEKGLIYHAEMDAHNMFPVSLGQIKEDFRQLAALSGPHFD